MQTGHQNRKSSHARVPFPLPPPPPASCRVMSPPPATAHSTGLPQATKPPPGAATCRQNPVRTCHIRPCVRTAGQLDQNSTSHSRSLPQNTAKTMLKIFTTSYSSFSTEEMNYTVLISTLEPWTKQPPTANASPRRRTVLLYHQDSSAVR